MANKTINDLTVTTSAASGDLVPMWVAASSVTRKVTKANFIGATITGGGTFATGGFTVTATGTSTINGSLVGNISGGGTVATGGFTLTVSGTSTINGSVVGSMTGSGTVATGGFTLTVPATGTAMLLGTAQTVSGAKTFTVGQIIDMAAANTALTLNNPSHTIINTMVIQNQGVDRMIFSARNALTQLTLAQADYGASTSGPRVVIGNNTNATGGPGMLSLYNAGGTQYYLWVTSTGVLRIGTTAPTTSDTIGTVVGTQT